MFLRESHPRATSQNFLQIEEEFSFHRHHAPLHPLRVTGRSDLAGSLLRVLDGGGLAYAEYAVDGEFDLTFLLGGELGWHRLQLLDASEGLLAEKRLWVDARTALTIAHQPLQNLWASLHASLIRNRRTILVDGKVVPYFIRWIRDDTHIQKAGVYWAEDTTSWMECFLDRQAPNGMLYDYACRLSRAPERPKVFGAEYSLLDLDNHVRWERLPSESDVEYLAVESVHRSWRASGDDERMRRQLPRLEKALEYCMSDRYRWSPEHQLVMRPYTIDTWDFKFFGFDRSGLVDEISLQDAVFNVHPDTPLCIMHGDNSGIYQACQQLAEMFRAVGENERAEHWTETAERIRARTNELCWNGEYYDHWVPVTPLEFDQGGVDGTKSFTLSNAYNLNRGIADHEQCVSIIRRYQSLREELKETHFAEWISAHPCWPKGFSGVPAGRYVNGGILTIVAGELARGAFRHGFESYAADILERLSGLLRVSPQEADRDYELFDQPYLFCGYTADGKPLDGIPDAWGQAAVAASMVEGLAGIVDRNRRFERVTISPRWVSSPASKANVIIRYPSSDGYVAYDFQYDEVADMIHFSVTGNATDWQFELLLPAGREVRDVRGEDEEFAFGEKVVEGSRYLTFEHTGRLVKRFVIRLQSVSTGHSK